MQRNLTKLWRALERIFSLNATLSEWHEQAGNDFSLLPLFLRPTNNYALCFACPSPGGEGCPRQIVETREGQILAVCGDQSQLCKTLQLEPKDIIVHELNPRKLTEMIALTLGVAHEFSELADYSQTWQVGNHNPAPNRRYPIYLSIATRQEDLQHTANRLFAIARYPFILIVPTRRYITLEMKDMLARINARFMTLEDMIVSNGEDTLSGSLSPELLLADFNAALFPANQISSNSFAMPPSATWEKLTITLIARDVIDVRYGKMDTVTIDRLHIPGMYNKNSTTKKETLAWALLRLFAEHDGMISVQTHGAHDLLKKHKQGLSARLKAYFQMEEDPIEWLPEYHAYKAKFVVRANVRL